MSVIPHQLKLLKIDHVSKYTIFYSISLSILRKVMDLEQGDYYELSFIPDKKYVPPNLEHLYTIYYNGGILNTFLISLKDLFRDLFILGTILTGLYFSVSTDSQGVGKFLLWSTIAIFSFPILSKILSIFLTIKRTFPYREKIDNDEWRNILTKNGYEKNVLEKFCEKDNILTYSSEEDWFPKTSVQISLLKMMIDNLLNGGMNFRRIKIVIASFYIFFCIPIFIYNFFIFLFDLFGDLKSKKTYFSYDFTPKAYYLLRNINEVNLEIEDKFLKVKEDMDKLVRHRRSLGNTFLSIIGDISLFLFFLFFLVVIDEAYTFGFNKGYFFIILTTILTFSFNSQTDEVTFSKREIVEEVKKVLPRFSFSNISEVYEIKIVTRLRGLFYFFIVGFWFITFDEQKIVLKDKSPDHRLDSSIFY